MIKYVPFLKAKQYERSAMSKLTPAVKGAICPFFDFPRKNEDNDSVNFIKTLNSIVKGLHNHWGVASEFYFDDLDINPSLIVDGECSYSCILKALNGMRFIPVVALDRTKHNEAVARIKSSSGINSTVVAFRANHTDFEDFESSKDQIEIELGSIFRLFHEIDLVLDCQLCNNHRALDTGREIARFAKKFCSFYNVRRVIVAGSSIPRSASEILKTDSSCIVNRKELDIIRNARDLSGIDLIPGDYTIIGPFYSDVELDPKIMQSVMTAKLVYSFDNSHYFNRGVSMKLGTYEQYFDLATDLCRENFFRGKAYSWGDNYFHEKSLRRGKSGTPGAVIQPSVVAHITYMVLDAKL